MHAMFCCFCNVRSCQHASGARDGSCSTGGCGRLRADQTQGDAEAGAHHVRTQRCGNCVDLSLAPRMQDTQMSRCCVAPTGSGGGGVCSLVPGPAEVCQQQAASSQQCIRRASMCAGLCLGLGPESTWRRLSCSVARARASSE